MSIPRVAGVALLVLAGTAPGLSQTPTFSTKVEAVRVDVLVTRGGQPVRGLQPPDFEILDNGVPQQVDLVSFEEVPLNVILSLDISASVSGERLTHLGTAGRALLDGLKRGDQAALVTFSHVVGPGFGLTADVGRVRAAIEKVRAGGNTALIDGSYAGMMVGESDVGRSLLIVFSDGLDTSSWLSAEAVLETARRSDVVVYGVSAGGGAHPEFLRDLCATTGGTLFGISSTRDLGAIFVRVLEEFRQRYLVSYSPRGVSKDGWHRIDVRVRDRDAIVKARPGYQAAGS